MNLASNNHPSVFLNSLDNILEAKSADVDFGIPELCQAMLMSRTNLHRKMVKYTGLSTSIYMREFRLEKANKILQTSNLPINRIAFETGFSCYCYFTKCFKNKYGIAPSMLRSKPDLKEITT